MMKFISKRPYYEILRKKWTLRHQAIQNKFWDSHGDALKHFTKDYDQNVLLAQVLSDKIPHTVRPLDPLEEKDISQILSRNFGFKVTAQIDSIRLNRNYGVIGGEQHLYRYPGDNLYAHADSASDFAKFGAAGIAPHLGAWGYFSPSQKEFREIDKLRERYYLAIQTFLIPSYAENFEKYRNFFKFRKMLVVNPATGQAVVGIIADAGPAEWTGKHLGGSPEVMDGLGLTTGPRQGPVVYSNFANTSQLCCGDERSSEQTCPKGYSAVFCGVVYFFIDDPKDEVPLGPVK